MLGIPIGGGIDLEKPTKSRLIKGIMERNLRLKIFLKLVLSFYLVLATFNYLISETDAYFLSEGELSISLKTGEWLFPELSFDDLESEFIDYCPINFPVTIINQGSADLSKPALYEVYFIESGHSKNGEKISEGAIEKLDVGSKFELTHEANRAGFYAVKVSYTAGEIEEEIWSNTIQVQCKSKPANNSQNTNDNNGSSENNVNENKEQIMENNSDSQNANDNEGDSETDSDFEGNDENKGNESSTENKEKTNVSEEPSLNNNDEVSQNDSKNGQNEGSVENESSPSNDGGNKTENP